jgi:hypothetical protein
MSYCGSEFALKAFTRLMLEIIKSPLFHITIMDFNGSRINGAGGWQCEQDSVMRCSEMGLQYGSVNRTVGCGAVSRNCIRFSY